MRNASIKNSIVAAFSSLLAIAGCGGINASPTGDGGTSGTGGNATCETSAPSTFDAIQEVIFEARGCTASACHGDATQGGLDLRTGASYASLVSVDSTRSDKVRVFPGEQGLSFLFEKVAAATNGTTLPTEAGGVMPAGGGAALSGDELEALRLWIRGGAQETGVVAGTTDLLECGLSDDADPNKLPVPDPPAADVGLQFYAGGWDVPAGKESEVCYATYYDVADQIPEMAKTLCTYGGVEQDCFAYRTNTLFQDPQSHHSIVRLYYGESEADNASWGDWTCLGGPNAGVACDPTQFGISATSGGADCGGAESACTTPVTTSFACRGWGPGDSRKKARGFSGSQTPISRKYLPDGVYDEVPAKGFLIWNSHAFNLTKKDTTVEQWVNLEYVGPELRDYRVDGIFDAASIFDMGPIQPFESNEICRTLTLDQYSQLIDISSHVHQRGIQFRIWSPPQPVGCEPARDDDDPATDCKPDTTKDPFYESAIYNDPVEIRYEPALAHNSADPEMRTYKFCGLFDNGEDDPANLKLNSNAPDSAICDTLIGSVVAHCGCPDSELRCVNDPTNTVACMGDDSLCDTAPGAGDGYCDACPLRGGVTTDDEMFILLGTYFVKPPVE